MRCIEILQQKQHFHPILININMRCIEMSFMFLGTLYNKRLTLTWDVLKFVWWICKNANKVWLTLTWDVLKWYTTKQHWRY